MLRNNYILGGGVAGLIAAFYNPGYMIIDANPLGQLNQQFIPGPRIFKDDAETQTFLKKLNIEFYSQKIKVGYTRNGHDMISLSEDFKTQYSVFTRKTAFVEKSFLSSGESEFNILTDGTDSFYVTVFHKLYEIVKNRIINSKIISINLKEKSLTLDDGSKTLLYNKCISTLNINIFTKLANLDFCTFRTDCKHFVCCSYDNEQDIKLSKEYSYIYSTTGYYSRKTYFKEYIVYEILLPLERINDMEGNTVIATAYNIPVQIQKSVDIRNIGGVELVGRFAQWNHSVKANEIIHKYER